MKKHVALLLLLAMLLLCGTALLIGCNPASDDPPAPIDDPTDDPTDPGKDDPTDPGKDDPVDDHAGCTDLTPYQLFCAESASDAVKAVFATLKDALKTACALEPATVTDPAAENRAEYEIIVGHSEGVAEECTVWETLAEGEYAILQSGTKLILTGKGDEETVYAVTRFMETVLNYSTDRYQNASLGTTWMKITDEKDKMQGKLLDSGRKVVPVEECWSDPLPYESFGELAGATSLHFTGTKSRKWNEKLEEGSYRLQFDVDITSDTLPNVQVMVAFPTAESLSVQISGNRVTVGRASYERGSTTFVGDPRHYTFRMDFHPEAQMIRYYINGVFMSEVTMTDKDMPLEEDATVSITCVGGGINMDITNIYIESIDASPARRYHDPGIVVDVENVYPKSENRPADTVYVVNAYIWEDDILTLMTLQGLVNRTTPSIFFDYRSYNQDPRYRNNATEEDFVELLKKKGYTVVEATVDELLVRFADCYDGVIVGNAFATNYGENVTTSLAGVLNGVYMTEEKYATLRDSIKKDVLFRIDGRWQSDVDAYMWVWNTYRDSFCDTLLYYMPGNAQSNGFKTEASRDYAVMSRAFCFCTTGVECLEDYDFYMSVMASTAVNSGVIGAPWAGCFTEFEMFDVCGQFAKFFTYGYATPNMSYFNNMEIGELKQKAVANPLPKPEADTVYVCFDLSEGDNLSWDYHLWNFTFRNEEGRAATPKGFSICGAMWYLEPAILEYYYDAATPNDYFFLDGGSIGNIGSPDSYASMYYEDERDIIIDEMLEILDYVAEKTDCTILRALNYVSDDMTAYIAECCPNITAVFSSYGNNAERMGGSGNSYSASLYMVGDTVRAKCFLTTFAGDLGTQLNALVRQTGGGQPFFAEVFVYANQVLDNIAYIQAFQAQLEATGKKIVYLRPDEFVKMYADYAG